MKREKIAEKLKKIKALAERGEGGEKETAMKMYRELAEKYQISEEEIDAEHLEKRWFAYKDEQEEKLLLQIFYKVTGSTEHYVYTGKYKRRKKRGCVCTELEAARNQTSVQLLQCRIQTGTEILLDGVPEWERPLPG